MERKLVRLVLFASVIVAGCISGNSSAGGGWQQKVAKL
jgi:hypothetical protein